MERRRNAFLGLFDAPWYTDWLLWLFIVLFGILFLGTLESDDNQTKPGTIIGILWFATLLFGFLPGWSRLLLRRLRWYRGLVPKFPSDPDRILPRQVLPAPDRLNTVFRLFDSPAYTDPTVWFGLSWSMVGALSALDARGWTAPIAWANAFGSVVLFSVLFGIIPAVVRLLFRHRRSHPRVDRFRQSPTPWIPIAPTVMEPVQPGGHLWGGSPERVIGDPSSYQRPVPRPLPPVMPGTFMRPPPVLPPTAPTPPATSPVRPVRAAPPAPLTSPITTHLLGKPCADKVTPTPGSTEEAEEEKGGSASSRVEPRQTVHWDRIDADDFEHLITRLLEVSGDFHRVNRYMATRAPDGGRDIEAYRVVDGTGLLERRDERVFIQAKHWSKRGVNASEVSDLVHTKIPLWEGAPVALLIVATSGSFTRDAIHWMEKHNDQAKRPRVEYWNRGRLEGFLHTHSVLLREFKLI